MFSGVKKVQYSTDTSGAFGTPVDLGVPMADSAGYTPDLPQVEIGNGQQLYAGKKNKVDFNFADLSTFAALETAMKADTAISVRLTFLDDTTKDVITAGYPKVKYNYGMAVGGRNTFNLVVEDFTT